VVRPVSAMLALAPLACVETYVERTAYDDQRYLCSGEHRGELDRQIEECRADEHCYGLMSLQGRLQGIDVTVETKLQSVEALQLHYPDETIRLHWLYLSGRSPYFYFVLKNYAVGVDPRRAPLERSLTWDLASHHNTISREYLEDERVGGELRIETALESVALGALSDSGTIELSVFSEAEYSGRFNAAFGVETDQIEGCFHAFASEIRQERP
jgi:hypothetical protein